MSMYVTFYFYIKPDSGFYEWAKRQNSSQANEQMPEGVRFIEVLKPVFGDLGRLHARFNLEDFLLIDKIIAAAKVPGFLSELYSFMDRNRKVEILLDRKIISDKI